MSEVRQEERPAAVLELPVEQRSVAEIRRAPLVTHDDVSVVLDTGRFEQVVRFASMMAQSKTVPEFLRNSAADCFRVTEQAIRWNLSPYAICDKVYMVGGKLAYEGQLIAAVVHSRAGLEGRLFYEFEGDASKPSTLKVVVSGRFKNEERTRIVEVTWTAGEAMSKGAKDKWKSQPEQQLSYFAVRVWARRHCPEIILGAYTPEELLDDTAERPLKDVTPPARPTRERPQIAEAEVQVDDQEIPGKEQAEPGPFHLMSPEGAEQIIPTAVEARDQMADWLSIAPNEKAVQGLLESNLTFLGELREINAELYGELTTHYEQVIAGFKKSAPAHQEENRQDDRPPDPPPAGATADTHHAGAAGSNGAADAKDGSGQTATKTASLSEGAREAPGEAQPQPPPPPPPQDKQTAQRAAAAPARRGRNDLWASDNYTLTYLTKEDRSYDHGRMKDRMVELVAEAVSIDEVNKFERDNKDNLRTLWDAYPSFGKLVDATFGAQRDKIKERTG